MKLERLVLIAFLGNYVLNNIAAGAASLLPSDPQATSLLNGRYVGFVVLAAITVGVFAWWHLQAVPRHDAIVQGGYFGALGFVIAVAAALLSGLAGVLIQTGSLAQMLAAFPRFWPFFFHWSTAIMFGFWIVPALLVGWLMRWSMKKPAAPAVPRPMI